MAKRPITSGGRAGGTVLSAQARAAMRRDRAAGATLVDLASAYGTTQATVSRVCYGVVPKGRGNG
jgi:aryl-alcohol dehydrogenase-like predicted oxidoreductase